MEPLSVPHMTIPTSEKKMVIATNNQCGPYSYQCKLSQAVILKKPIVPNMTPKVNPDKISLRITNHQSRKESSRKAIALMISVASCEPLLPPLEIISGTNKASTTACDISLSK